MFENTALFILLLILSLCKIAPSPIQIIREVPAALKKRQGLMGEVITIAKRRQHLHQAVKAISDR